MVRLWLTLAVSQVLGRVPHFPWCTPRCFNEFAKALRTANVLVYGERNKKNNINMAARFSLSNHFSPGHKIVLVAWGTCAIFLNIFGGLNLNCVILVLICQVLLFTLRLTFLRVALINLFNSFSPLSFFFSQSQSS